MKKNEKLDRLLSDSTHFDKTSPELDHRILTDAAGILETADSESKAKRISVISLFPKPFSLFLCALILGFILFWWVSSSRDSYGKLFAGVIKKLDTVNYIKTKMTVDYGNSSQQKDIIVAHTTQYYARNDVYDERFKLKYFFITDFKKNSVLYVYPESKHFKRVTPREGGRIARNPEIFFPKRYFKQLLTEDFMKTGSEEIDGVPHSWFHRRGKLANTNFAGSARILINESAMLPVRYELSSKYGKLNLKIVMSDFQWKSYYDRQLFRYRIPDDYTERE